MSKEFNTFQEAIDFISGRYGNDIGVEEAVARILKEYRSLKEDSNWLICLEAAGVDNWSGISYAYEMREEMYDE